MSKEAVAEMKAFANKWLTHWTRMEGMSRQLNLPERHDLAYKCVLYKDLLANLDDMEEALNRRAARRVA